MINNLFNFVMSIFAIYMLEKMSRAEWSIEHNDSEEARQTTQMDREVGAGLFDYKMVDKNFKFRNFTHNIPRASTSSNMNSDHSSYISSSSESSEDMDNDYYDVAKSLRINFYDDECQ